MPSNKKQPVGTSPYIGRAAAGELSARLGRRSSGAAGIHADQQTKALGTTRTNRVGSRSARRRAGIEDQR